MRYTPAQILDITQMSRETLRYWRNVLPPLGEKKGKTARYSAGDLLALLIIKEMVTAFDMNIAVIAPVSQQIFTTCQGIKWHQSSDKQLSIDIKEGNVTIISTKAPCLSSCGLTILIDIGFWQSRLRELLVTDETVQFALTFNPQLVRNKHSAVR